MGYRKSILKVMLLTVMLATAAVGCTAPDKTEENKTEAFGTGVTDTQLAPSDDPQGEKVKEEAEEMSVLEEVQGSESDELCGLPTAEEPQRMVMVDDKLYIDTGETSQMERCGVMDFSFDSAVESGEPTQNYQTNFGVGYDGQCGTRSNRIEILIDDVWHVFACNENNLEGVMIEAMENTNHSIKLKICSESSLDIQYGEYFELEFYDEEIKTWTSIPMYVEAAFPDIAYTAKAEGKEPFETTWEADWSAVYGELAPGRYRIAKEFIDYRTPGDYTEYTLTAEFDIDAQTASETEQAAETSESGYTIDELCEKALNHYEAFNGYRPPICMCESEDGNEVVLHLFELTETHTATSDWYSIDKTTGKGTNFMGEEIDISGY